jgi:hypothetical protein
MALRGVDLTKDENWEALVVSGRDPVSNVSKHIPSVRSHENSAFIPPVGHCHCIKPSENCRRRLATPPWLLCVSVLPSSLRTCFCLVSTPPRSCFCAHSSGTAHPLSPSMFPSSALAFSGLGGFSATFSQVLHRVVMLGHQRPRLW